MLVTQGEPSRSSISTTSVAASNDKKLPQTIANRGVGSLLNVGFDQKKDNVVEIRTNPLDDSSLTPPSVTGTVTNVQDNNMCPFGVQQGKAELLADQKKASLAASSSHLLSPLVSANDDFKKDQSCSAGNVGSTCQSKLVLFGCSKFKSITIKKGFSWTCRTQNLKS